MPKGAAKKSPFDVVLTGDQAAELINLTTRRLQQLAGEGWIKRNSERGGYTPLAVVHGYIEFLTDESRRTSKSAADSRVRDMRADEIGLRIMERSKELINEARADAMAMIDEVIGGLRADIMAVPARVTADLEVRRKIEAAHDDVFRQASKRASDRSKGVDEDFGPLGAEPENDA